MSFHVFFGFSQGLSGSLFVPPGTIRAIMEHVSEIETTFGFETTQYLKNPPHWKSTIPSTEITDEVYCLTADRHNAWVRNLYAKFGEWSKSPVKPGEELTPKKAAKFWHALTMVEVPPERWTEDYYRARMEHLYEVMRGRPNEGVTFEAKPLTEKQAADVINLFSNYLDVGDLRLDVPNGRDYLASSSDGGYDWCEKCGPMVWDDVRSCRQRGCPLLKEMRAEERE